jgi:hypothetical protein
LRADATDHAFGEIPAAPCPLERPDRLLQRPQRTVRGWWLASPSCRVAGGVDNVDSPGDLPDDAGMPILTPVEEPKLQNEEVNVLRIALETRRDAPLHLSVFCRK